MADAGGLKTGGPPRSAAVAQVACGLLAVLMLVGTVGAAVSIAPWACWSHPEPHCVEKFWGTLAIPAVVAVGLWYAACALDAPGRAARRRAWWVGTVVGVLIASLGMMILFSPVWTHETGLTQMLPELVGGLLVLAVAGVLLGSLLAPATRRWVREGPSPVPAPLAGDGRWRVAEPGADLIDRLGGTGIVARLAPGTVLVEIKRRRDHILVTTPDGQSGWVEQRRLH